MTEEQIEKYIVYLRRMIKEKSKSLTETTDHDMKNLIHGKLEAYTFALNVFAIIMKE